LIRVGKASEALREGLRLRSLSGHLIPVVGVAKLEVVGKHCDFHVVEELQHDLLIGTDVMEELKGVLCYEKASIRLNGVDHGWIGRRAAYADVSGVVAEVEYWRGQFPKVFPEVGAPLAPADVLEMVIDTGTARPINQRPYRIPLAKMKLVEEELDKMLREGIIEPSSSPWASPLTMVPKKDGSVRICGDYRRLNEVTQKDAYPLPRIQDIFDQLGGAKVFTTIDLKSGYWQVKMAEASKEKTAISTHRGLFQFRRMQFGLTNAPANFQRMMSTVLAKHLGKSCLIYLDDVVIYSRDEQTHRGHVSEVLEALSGAGLVVKESKCTFGVKEVKLLGFVVCGEGLKADPDKVAAIRDMAPPTDKKGVRRVLGSANYYRQLMVNYADVVAPLTKLTRKAVKFEWDESCQKAWGELKELLLECVILKFPDPTKPYKLYTDASNYSIGAILVQADENGLERPVHLISGRLNSAQMNYPTIEKEAFAIIYALIKLRPYLYGADFVIYTDHQPLKCLFTKEQKNSRIQRWSVLLSEFAAPISYIKGLDNGFADMLSRLRPEKEAVEPEEMSTVLVAAMEEETPFEYYKVEPGEVERLHRDTPEWEWAKKGEKDYVLLEGMVYSLVPPTGKTPYPRLVLPMEYRQRVLQKAHEDVGHMAVGKTLGRVQEHFRWGGMLRDTVDYVNKCAKCAINKVKRDYPLPTEMPLPQAPGLIVAADLTGPFPESPEGNKYLLSIIDHCSGWVEVKAIPNKTAECIHNYLLREYLPRHSTPEVFLTDNGLEFKNKLVVGLMETMGAEVRHSTPYHPQSNGMVERYHRTLKQMLAKLVNSRSSNWESYLGDVLLAHRTTCAGPTGFTPFFLNYGRHPNLPHKKLLCEDSTRGDAQTQLGRRVEELADTLKEAVCNRAISRQYNTLRAVNRANAIDLKEGDRVLLRVNEPGPLDRVYDPGFIVTRVRGAVITVVGPNSQKRVVNRDQVKLADEGIDWSGLNPRETRASRKRTKQRLTQQRRAECDFSDNARLTDKGTGGRVNKGGVKQNKTSNDCMPVFFPIVCDKGNVVDSRGGADRVAPGKKRVRWEMEVSRGQPEPSEKRQRCGNEVAKGAKRQWGEVEPASTTDHLATHQRPTSDPPHTSFHSHQAVPPEARLLRQTHTGASKRAAPTSDPPTRVLRSHTAAGTKARLVTHNSPTGEEQQTAKRACIEFVIAFMLATY